MVNLQKERGFSKWILYVVIPLAVFSVAIITLFIIMTNHDFQDSKGVDVPSETVSEQEGLGTIKPAPAGSEKKAPGGKETEGGEGGGGGDETPESPPVEGFNGALEIDNVISRDYTSSNLGLVHYSEAEEGLDKYDSNYYAMFDSSGIASKIISRVGENELDNDARPDTSKTEFLIELSLVSQSGGDVSISSPNELRVLMPLEGYTFGSQKLVLQQYDPDDPSEIIADYDVRELIEEGEGVGIIKLPDINGNHKSGEPYAYFKLIFK